MHPHPLSASLSEEVFSKRKYNILPGRKVSVKIVKCREYMELVKESIVCGDTSDTNADTVNNYWSPLSSPVKYSTIRSYHSNSNCIKIMLLFENSASRLTLLGSVHINLIMVSTIEIEDCAHWLVVCEENIHRQLFWQSWGKSSLLHSLQLHSVRYIRTQDTGLLEVY